MSSTAIATTKRRLLSAFAIVALALAWHVGQDPGGVWQEFQAGFHDAFDPGAHDR